MSRFASWFCTTSGRRFTYWCVGGTALATFGSQVAVHGPYLHKIKEIFQVYSHGKPRPLPEKVNGLIEKVLQDSHLKEEQKKKLKFFYVVGHELFHAGGNESPWGAIIGIPFTFEDVENINLNELKVPGKDTIDWIIEGQDLIEAMAISDDAKKFALLREIYSCKFSDVLTNATIGAGCVLLPARAAQMSNAKLNAFERSTLRQRSFRYAALYTIGFIFYRLLKDPVKHLSDQEADKLAAETGINYLNGGIEYYEKTLMKNKALGEFFNTSYRKIYDEQGNEHYIMLSPKLPVTKRLEYLQLMKKEQFGKVDRSD